MFLSFFAGRSDAGIIVKSVDCLGNLTQFDFPVGSGLTISSINWYFGDGATSINIKTSHIYKNKGIYKVKADVNLSNGSKQADSVQIEIVGLPVSDFEYESYSDSCFSNNIICFKDKSRQADTGQTITKRILVWGDGATDKSNLPFFDDLLCHTYLNTGSFKATMEVTDKFGCKSITSLNYNIVGSVTAGIKNSLSYVDCKNMALCLSNISQIKQPAKVKYYWRIDSLGTDTNAHFIKPACVYYKHSKTVKATLVAVTNSGCMDSISGTYMIDIKPLPDKLLLSDSVICYGDLKNVNVIGPAYTADLIEWKIDGAVQHKSTYSGFGFSPKVNQIMPGKHVLLCSISRGNCNVVLTANFVVKGPVARIGMVNQYQCSTLRQVSMYDQSGFLDTNNAEYFWKIKDIYGGKCTTNYVKDSNLYSNCNYAIGSHHKHIYSQLSNSNNVTLVVKDNTSGCVDSTTTNVEFLRCSKLFNRNNYVICQGDYFLTGYQGGVNDPILFTLDSGLTWKKFPSRLFDPYKGVYNVGFIFEKSTTPWAENIGNDSFKINMDTLVTYDTLYKYKFLKVLENKFDSLYYIDYFKCGDNRVSVFFKNKLFYAGEKIVVDWDDSTSTEISFTKTTIVDSIQHRFLVSGVVGVVKVKLYSVSGCNTLYSHPVNFGKSILLNLQTPLCLSNKICMQAGITENYIGKQWSDLNNKKLVWIFDDTVKYVNLLSVCHKFKTFGNHTYRIIATDSMACSDTIQDKLFVQDVKAVIANTPKVLFCSELRQFFDSSYALNPIDSIRQYLWDFGDNTYNSSLKDPFISFNSSADSVVITHVAETKSGCVDTTRVSILLAGGKPYFTIKDTIACGSLDALFFNKSRNCSSYIWEFGDDLNSTFDVNDTQYVRFNYLKPGRYHIKLRGIDTIYNPSTGNTYYCISVFPGKDSVRDVLVLPVIKTAVFSKDTICLGDSLSIGAKPDPEISANKWYLGNGDMRYIDPPLDFKYLYKSPGVFKISFHPVIKATSRDKVCADSAEKTVTVLSVKADFIKDPQSRMPYLTLNNRSQPSDALLKWDFGQPSTGSLNSSTEQDPSVLVVAKFKPINICLKASIPFGCIDSICKPFIDNDSASIMIYNVFTPGNGDGKNDCYDISIAGEDIYDLLIYDRWGVLVFEGDTDAEYMEQNNWNGKVRNTGAECPDGTYYYIFRYRIPLLSGETKTVNGVIQLIR